MNRTVLRNVQPYDALLLDYKMPDTITSILD